MLCCGLGVSVAFSIFFHALAKLDQVIFSFKKEIVVDEEQEMAGRKKVQEYIFIQAYVCLEEDERSYRDENVVEKFWLEIEENKDKGGKV